MLLVDRGYEVTHGDSEAFLESGPAGETITLTHDSLAVFTGCVVGRRSLRDCHTFAS